MAMDITRRITTAQALLEAGDIGRCELSRGRLRVMTPAGYEHGLVAMRIAFRLMAYATRHAAGSVTGAETGFLVAESPDTVLAPDVAFVSRGRAQATSRYFVGPPDLAVEVVSPNDRPGEIEEKARSWIDAGVRLLWIADPAMRTIVERRGRLAPREYRGGEATPAHDVLPGFSLDVDDAFDVSGT
jgi:Uma2 family endonuclease